MYLDTFTLPIDFEEPMIQKQCERNGGIYGYIDNTYPCRMFENRELYEISFKNVTIFYGGNGSGKSTLLNLIAQKLELNRIAPFNSSELFDEYVKRLSVSPFSLKTINAFIGGLPISLSFMLDSLFLVGFCHIQR